MDIINTAMRGNVGLYSAREVPSWRWPRSVWEYPMEVERSSRMELFGIHTVGGTEQKLYGKGSARHELYIAE